jgi:PAS domain S-box-containing protein
MSEATKKVLVIDDNEDNLLTLKALITDLFSGFVTHIASGGVQGIELAKTHQPDVILLDIIMPVMDGFETCKILKEDEDLRDIPVVFVTAMKENRENKLCALESGADGFITKPIDDQELFAQIKSMLKISEANKYRKSERQRLEDIVNERTRKLQETEQLHLESQALAHLGHWKLNLKTDDIKWSDEVYRIFGLQPQQFPITNEIFNNYIHPDDRDFVKKKFRLSIAQKAPYVIEHRILLNNGIVRYVYEKATTYYDDEGNPMHTIGTVMDITDRKQVEQKLRDAIEQRDSLASNIPVTIYQYRIRPDGTSHFPYISEGIRKITGFDPDELAEDAEIAFRNIHPEYLNHVRESIGEAARTLTRWHDEFLLNHRNGQTLWLEGESTPQQMSDGSILWHGYFRDITEKKQIEYQLLKLSQAVEQSPASTVITNREGIIEYVNPKFTEVTGYTREEAIGKNPRILKSGVQSDALYKELWDTITSGNNWKGELNNKRKNGELYWESVSISPIKNEIGEISYYVAVKEDITELKQAENNFRYSIDQSPIGIRIEKESGETVYANKSFLEIYNFATLSEFTETTTKERYTEKSYLEHLERKKIREKGTEVNEYEVKICSKDAKIRHLKVWRKEVIWNKQKHFQIINLDITGQKETEQALRKSEEKYRNLFAKMMNAFALHEMIFDDSGEPVDYRFMEVNPAWEKMVGFNAKDVKGKTIREIMPDIEEEWIQVFGRVAKTGISKEFEEYNAATKKNYHLFAYCPAPGQFAVFFNDITDRWQKEKQVIESEKQFRALFTDSASIMMLVDPDTQRIVDVNKAALRFYGYDHNTLTSMSVSNINTLSEEELSIEIKRALSAEKTHFMLMHRLADGTVKPVEIYSGSISYSGKDLLYSIIHDISEQKRNEETILKLSQAISQSSVSVAITTKEGVVEYVNARFSELTGYTIDEIKNKELRIFKPGKLSEYEYQTLLKSVTSGKEWRGEYQNRKKNNDFYWEQVVISPIRNNQGEITNLIVNCEDITERKNIELKLKHTLNQLKNFGSHLQKVREEEKVLLAREIHDDLGQLLVAMKIDIGMTRSSLNKELTIALKNSVSDRLSNHIEMITKAISSARRIMNGLRPAKLEMLGFAGAAQDYINDFSSRNNIQIATRVDVNIEKLDDDRSLALYRILQETLNNIIKHANADKVEIVYQKINNELHFQISDNGVGFDSEKDVRDDSYGLIGIKERVLILNGTISITSAPGKGTQISIRFPLD